jgi:hypothetical protein
MRKVFLFGAVILFAGSVGVGLAQERLPGTGVGEAGLGPSSGESSGTGTRSQTWDKSAFLERLSQAETVFGRVLAIDIPGKKLHLETGGSSHDEGRAGTGAMSSLTLYMDGQTNVELIRGLNAGDDVIVTAREETTTAQPYGTGRKLVRDVTVLRGNEKMAGFGGLGQRPNPNTERGIETNSGGVTGGIPNQMMPGEVEKALGFNSNVGEVTGAAPCWQCNPQPGWGNASSTNSDYGSSEKPQFMKGQ